MYFEALVYIQFGFLKMVTWTHHHKIVLTVVKNYIQTAWNDVLHQKTGVLLKYPLEDRITYWPVCTANAAVYSKYIVRKYVDISTSRNLFQTMKNIYLF